MSRQLVISKKDGEQLTVVHIPNGFTTESAIKQMLASLQPEVQKKTGKPTKTMYNSIKGIEPADDDTKIVFKYEEGKNFYIDLRQNRLLHSDGTEFLTTHYDRIDTIMDELIPCCANALVKRFLAYFRHCSFKCLGVNYRTEKLGSYLKAFIGTRFVNPIERLAKSGVLGTTGYTEDRFKDIDIKIDFAAEDIYSMLHADQWFLKQFRNEGYSRYTLDYYNSALESPPAGDAFRYALERYGYIIDDSDRRIILELVRDHGLDWKRLVDYYISELPIQGEDPDEGLTLLRDYLTMAKDIGGEYERYPKYLSTRHNMVRSKHKLHEDKYLQHRYERLIENKNLKRFNFTRKGSKYFIRIPNTLAEIAEEGDKLHHCVASYTKRMVEGFTMILFMREKKYPNDSLVTIEIGSNRIIQAKGEHNRQPSPDEMDFINKYIEHLNKKKISDKS